MSKTKKTQNPNYKRYISWFWGLFFGGLLFAILIFLLASWGVFGSMPDHTQLENVKTNLASEIISSDAQTIGKFYFIILNRKFWQFTSNLKKKKKKITIKCYISK